MCGTTKSEQLLYLTDAAACLSEQVCFFGEPNGIDYDDVCV